MPSIAPLPVKGAVPRRGADFKGIKRWDKRERVERQERAAALRAARERKWAKEERKRGRRHGQPMRSDVNAEQRLGTSREGRREREREND